MPKRKLYSTIGMRERQFQQWHKRVKQGDAYELPGAFGDRVYVPRVVSDTDPVGASQFNRQRLRKAREIIKKHKKRRQKTYRDLG